MRLSGQAQRLLLFYADQAEGFTPSLEWIHQNTGLDRKDISKIRRQLTDNGFIRYEQNKVIELDWNRVRLYATLDKKMLPTKRGRAQIAPVGSIPHDVVLKPSSKIKHQLRKFRYVGPAPVRNLSPAEKHFFRVLEEMTEDEVRSLFGYTEIRQADEHLSRVADETNACDWFDLLDEELPHSRDPLPF